MFHHQNHFATNLNYHHLILWEYLNRLLYVPKKNLIYLQVPTTEKEWADIANEYEELWNFSNCVGAIDGKHMNMKCPVNSGF